MGKHSGVLVNDLSSNTTIEEVKAMCQDFGRVRSAFKASNSGKDGSWSAIVLFADEAAQ